MGPLRNFFLGSSFSLNSGFDTLQNKDNDRLYELQGSPRAQHDDFGIFAHYAGPAQNHVVIITGFADTALLQIAEYMTDPTMLAQLDDNIPGKNFELLFRVSGFDREVLESQIQHIAEVDINAIWLKRH